MKEENGNSNNSTSSFEADTILVIIKAVSISFASFLLALTNPDCYVFLMATAYSAFIIFKQLTKN